MSSNTGPKVGGGPPPGGPPAGPPAGTPVGPPGPIAGGPPIAGGELKKRPPQTAIGGGQKPHPRKNQVVDDNEDKKGGGKECCKKALKFTFSHIGLCGMVIAYSIAGGFIFQHLEKTNEQQECVQAQKKYEPLENITMFKLWDIASSFRNPEDMEYALMEFQKQLIKFRGDVLELGYDGKNCSAMDDENGPGYQWSFSGALLFSVTVITTIGYGNIAPKTYWGRLVCIAYATLGIPLMLLCLANIGDVMADIFRFVYTKVCCCGCCRRKDKNKVETLKNGNGNKGQGDTLEAWKNQYAAQMGMESKGGPVVVDDDDDDDDDDEDEKISVPLTITMGVIGGYIFMGALLFGVWEKWDPLKASYFCFVTISTIGFGDVVPGSATFQNDSDQYKMVGAAIYMLFGMAILSMCFSLIQEEIVAKFRWVGEKIGIIEKDKAEDDDDEDDDDKDKKEQQKGQQKGKPAGGPPPTKPGPRPTGPNAPHMAGGQPPPPPGVVPSGPPRKAAPMQPTGMLKKQQAPPYQNPGTKAPPSLGPNGPPGFNGPNGPKGKMA